MILIKNKLFKSASYLIDQYLVDCGDAEAIIETASKSCVEIQGIFLTHCHQDHVYGLEKVLDRFPSAKVFCTNRTYEGLKDSNLNLSFIIPEYAFTFVKDENIVIVDEGKHNIKGLEVEVISTAGHSDDCVSYIIGDAIFTGDAYIPFAKVFTKWPTSNKEQAFESENRIMSFVRERNLTVFPGHWK